MPFIVRYPAEVKAGVVNEHLGMNIDFGPTMLDYAGVKIPAPMQGVSLRPLLRGQSPDGWRTGIFYAYYARAPMHWGIRTQRYKLIHFPHTDEFEFYDLKFDPREMRNVANDPNYRTTIGATAAKCTALWAADSFSAVTPLPPKSLCILIQSLPAPWQDSQVMPAIGFTLPLTMADVK